MHLKLHQNKQDLTLPEDFRTRYTADDGKVQLKEHPDGQVLINPSDPDVKIGSKGADYQVQIMQYATFLLCAVLIDFSCRQKVIGSLPTFRQPRCATAALSCGGIRYYKFVTKVCLNVGNMPCKLPDDIFFS